MFSKALMFLHLFEWEALTTCALDYFAMMLVELMTTENKDNVSSPGDRLIICPFDKR